MAWSKTGPSAAEKLGKREAVEAKFETQYGMKPPAFIRAAVLVAYGTSSKASGYQGRSLAGRQHSDNVSPSNSPDPLVVAYHKKEDAGKTCAQNGDVEGAIRNYDEAAEMRQQYPIIRKKPEDQAHRDAISVLTRRRASLSSLQIDLRENDPGVVAARLLVRNFFQAEGLTSPY